MLKIMVKDLIHRAGWVIHRFDPHAHNSFQFLQSLDHVDVNLIFDIGANEGQFAQRVKMDWV